MNLKEIVLKTSELSRRALFGLGAGTLGALVLANTEAIAAPVSQRQPIRSRLQERLSGPFSLPLLHYGTAALAPHIDQLTMEIHHGKHHQAYIDNLNKIVVENPDIAELLVSDVLLDLTVIPESIRQGVRNNLGGHVNHSAFWNLMTPNSLDPSANLVNAIERDFGSIEAMQTAVNEAGLKRFGSGWTWLVVNEGVLSVVSTANQDNPVMDGLGWPILGIDVWEHAYYLNYQNRRADYLTAWWNVCNWFAVDQAFSWMSQLATPTT